MPPGMIMDRNTPAAAMLDMAAVDPRDVVSRVGLDTRGDRELASRIDGGVKAFDLEASVIRWTILPGITVDAYAFNSRLIISVRPSSPPRPKREQGPAHRSVA
jgi:hypothetical protein